MNVDIDDAARAMGVDLLPWQRDIGQRILNGEQLVLVGGKRAGRKTLMGALAKARELSEPAQCASIPTGADEREALANLIDTKLDGDAGHGVGAFLADAILHAGFRRPALLTVTDDMVERAQEAFYEFAFGPGQVSPRQKSVTRQAWRVALTAALAHDHKPSEGES